MNAELKKNKLAKWLRANKSSLNESKAKLILLCSPMQHPHTKSRSRISKEFLKVKVLMSNNNNKKK